MDTDKLIVFSLALSSIGLYAAFLPPVSYIATNYQSDDEKQVLREAELIGTAHLIVVAIVTGIIAHTMLPLYLAGFFCISMFATYEYALARVTTT